MASLAVEDRGAGITRPAELSVAALTRRYAELWRGAGEDPPELGPRVSALRQLRSYREARRLVDWLAVEVERFPGDEAARKVWRRRVRERVQRFGEQRLGWPRAYRRLLFAEGFFDSSVEFVRAARAFDPDIRTDDLGQALRNVWIANSLQMLLDLPVRSTPAVFGYSMIYPYSDNLLDDPAIGAAAKRGFNRRLRRRLVGEPVAALGGGEARVFALVGEIESEHDRERRPRVFDSLLAIQRGQERSLEQQGRRLGRDQILEISAEKGGSSVLADGYLVAGELTAYEADFCFGYGVLLQLLDDLQDVRTDLAAGHRTLFTLAAREGPLDAATARLLRLMDPVLDGSPRFSDPRCEAVKDLIRRNCTFLLVGAVAASRELFSRGFRRRLQRRWPFTFRAMERLRDRSRRRYAAVAESLRRQRGVDSLLDLLDRAGEPSGR